MGIMQKKGDFLGRAFVGRATLRSTGKGHSFFAE